MIRLKQQIQIRKTLRNNSGRSVKTELRAGIDTWLLRLSHVSQLGLFALTLGALYFTVIPLYKVATLEESIARREAELKAAETKLNLTEVALRGAEEKYYRRERADVLRRFVSMAGATCSGLLDQAPHAVGVRFQRRPRLQANVAACLQDELQKVEPEKVLHSPDLIFLQSAVASLASELERQRKAALADIATVPERATTDASILAPLGPFEQEAQNFLAELRRRLPPQKPESHLEFERAVERTREAIAAKFEEKLRTEVSKLRDIKWPDSTNAAGLPSNK